MFTAYAFQLPEIHLISLLRSTVLTGES